MKLKLDGYILGPMLRYPIFFKKKIRVALESRTLIWVPLLQAMTLKLKQNYMQDTKLLLPLFQ